MCNREISSRRIDCFFREALRLSGADCQGGGGRTPPPPDRPRYKKCPDRARVKGSLRVMLSTVLRSLGLKSGFSCELQLL